MDKIEYDKELEYLNKITSVLDKKVAQTQKKIVIILEFLTWWMADKFH